MGGDSAGVAGYSLTQRRDPKVFRVGRLVIGYTSSFRMAQLIRYGWDGCLSVADLAPPESGDGMEFMCRELIPRVRYLWKRGGWLGKKENAREVGGTFLVAWGRRLFKVENDLQVGMAIDTYDACGCGEDLALGALHATKGTSDSPHKRIMASLKAAEHFSAGVCRPFTIVSTNDPESTND
jgi:hypothetical protein